MEACSPKDGFVAKLLVSDEAQVSKGDLILEMESEHEDRADERLAAADATREIAAAQYIPPQVDVIRRIATAAVKLAEKNLALSQEARNDIAKFVDFGRADHQALLSAEIDLAKAKIEHNKAKDQLAKFEIAVDRHNKTNEVAKQHTLKEREFIAKRKLRLRVFAPKSGTIKQFVAEGSFAELGSTLFEVK